MKRQQVAMLAALVLLLALVAMSYLWGPFQRADETAEDVALVQGNDIEVQKQALFALAQSSSEQSLKHLIQFATTHDDPEVRKQAIFWLGQKGNRAALEALDQIAQEDQSLEVQKQVIFAYSQLPREVGSPRLVRIARSHAHRELREQAIFWLGQQGGEDALALFDEIIAGEDDVALQKKVIFAYSQMPKDLGVPRLIALAKSHPSEEVRKQAVFWLGQANDDRAREALVDLVQRR